MTIEELMEALPGAYRPEKAAGWNCRFHFRFEEAQNPEWTVAIADGLLYAADLTGFFYCFDARTGEQIWRHDTVASVWGFQRLTAPPRVTTSRPRESKSHEVTGPSPGSPRIHF